MGGCGDHVERVPARLQTGVSKFPLETVFDCEMQLLELVLLRAEAEKSQETKGAVGESLCLSALTSKETAAPPAPPFCFVAAGSERDSSNFGHRQIWNTTTFWVTQDIGLNTLFFLSHIPKYWLWTCMDWTCPAIRSQNHKLVALERTSGVEVM